MSYKKFEELLKEKGTTTYRVSKATGISGATFSDWKSGRSSPKLDKIKMIADYFGVPIDYFLVSDAQSDSVFGYAPKKLNRVPVVGDIRAGKPIITSETLLGYENADIPDPDDYFYLRVKGDSMKNAGIVDRPSGLVQR